MTPEIKKPKKLVNANNYDIGDIKSDDSTDDESAPKKSIPHWALGKFSVDNLHEENYMGYRGIVMICKFEVPIQLLKEMVMSSKYLMKSTSIRPT